MAFTCDMEGMFHQVKVTEDCGDLLQFLWWENSDISCKPHVFRMTVHLFGATSSPCCTNFALIATANDNEKEISSTAAEFLSQDFYVDDGLKSVPLTDGAVKEMCRRGGFNLHKFIPNSKEVIQTIPAEDRAKEIKNLDLNKDLLPLEQALRVQWNIKNDSFSFCIILNDKLCTRRGILYIVSSICDPPSLIAPLLLEGKKILQELCKEDIRGDDPICICFE